jgi:hypothetical protein
MTHDKGGVVMAKRRKNQPKHTHTNRYENAPRGPKPAHKKRPPKPQPKAEETSSRPQVRAQAKPSPQPAPPSRSKGGGWRAYLSYYQQHLDNAAGGSECWQRLDESGQKNLARRQGISLQHENGTIWFYWQD